MYEVTETSLNELNTSQLCDLEALCIFNYRKEHLVINVIKSHVNLTEKKQILNDCLFMFWNLTFILLPLSSFFTGQEYIPPGFRCQNI